MFCFYFRNCGAHADVWLFFSTFSFPTGRQHADGQRCAPNVNQCTTFLLNFYINLRLLFVRKTRNFKSHYKKVTKLERKEKQRLQRLRKKDMLGKSTSGTPYQLAGESSRPCTAPPIPGSKRYIEEERKRSRRKQQNQAIEMLKEQAKVALISSGS
jgi:hypothetical protein